LGSKLKVYTTVKSFVNGLLAAIALFVLDQSQL
jgi:hypothetical protein